VDIYTRAATKYTFVPSRRNDVFGCTFPYIGFDCGGGRAEAPGFQARQGDGDRFKLSQCFDCRGRALIRQVTADWLQQAGFRVFEARSGEDAIWFLGHDEKVDVLFTDLRLGGASDGWDVAEAFRQKYRRSLSSTAQDI